MIRDHEKAVLKTWKLGKRNARIMGKLNQRFLGGFHTYFKLTLLGEGERRLGEQTYLKQVCSRGNTVLGPKPPRWNPGRAPRNLSRSMTVSIFKTVPSGNIITTYMRPLEREERLSYDFNKSPKISSSIFTCKVGYSNPGMSTYVDFARLAIGTYFRDPKSEPYNEGGGVISFFERGTYNNAVWFGYLFLEPNIAKQLKSGKMEVITAELN